jgi:hypothetical protein
MTHDAKQKAQEAADNMAARAKFLESLKADQRKALEKTFETIRDCLQMLHDCNDLYVSDVGKLEAAFWQLNNAFMDVKPSEWQLEIFAEHGVQWPPKK